MSAKCIVANMTTNARVTIPAEVRQHLGIVSGDKVRFLIEEDGRVKLEPFRDASQSPAGGETGNLQRANDNGK